MSSAVTTLNTEQLSADIQSFFAEHPIPQAGKTLDQVLERQLVNTELRKREASTLSASLR
jgi:hypothetical protein